MDKELPRFEPVTASSPVLYTATTPTTGFSAVHNTFAVYIDINIYIKFHRMLLEIALTVINDIGCLQKTEIGGTESVN